MLAPNAMTTLRKIKRKLQLPPEESENDEDIEDLINAASDYIEKFCDRKFGRNSYTELIAGTGRLKILVNNYPVVSVESINVSGDDIAPDDYEVISESGMLYRDNGWPERGFGVENLTYEVTEPKLNVKIKYTSGFVLPKDGTADTPRDLPWDLEQVCIKLVLLYYNDNDGTGGVLALKRETIGDWTGEYQVINPPNDGAEKVPYDIIQTLLKWRRMI